jgi:hypothetical protein
VGASNALRVYAAWGGILDDRPLRVLVYMALVARDKDATPWFSQGHDVLAEMALALPDPGSPQASRAVRRAITQLHGQGAIRTIKRATYGKRGTSNVHYRLYLDGPDPDRPQVTERPMDKSVDNSRPQVAQRPMVSESIGRSVVVHRSLSGHPQVAERPTKENEEDKELKDSEANLRNGEMWKASPIHLNGSAEPAEPATPRTRP